MNRFAVYWAGILLCAGFMVASAEEIILKNGSVIKGDIVEQVPGKTMTLSTRDGSIIVINVDDVERITKTPSTSAISTPLPGGVGFVVDAGVDIATKGGSGSGGANIQLEKHFSKNFSAGIGTGISIGFNDEAKPTVPIFADFKGLAPLSNSKAMPFIDLKAGYVLNTADDITVGSGKYQTTVKAPDHIMLSIMPGVRFPLGSKLDLDLGIGYQHYFPTSGDGGSGAIGFRVGLNFHKSTDEDYIKKRKEPKPVIPTRNNGFEFGIEAQAARGFGGNMLLGYKCNPNLSLAVGFGFSTDEIMVPSTEFEYYSMEDGEGNLLSSVSRGKHSYKSGHTTTRVFLRGEYRLNDNVISPIGRVDLGYNIGGGNITDDEVGDCYRFEISYNRGESYSNSCSSLFINPAVGLSWRVTNNSYLECALGFEICGGFSKFDEKYNETGTIHGSRYHSIRIMQDGKNLSHLNFAITWKRTFSLFSK